ncbi:MAG: LLM class flavin-dependent oxidoreductase, partial [Chloroflexi bacterium]|nr:LLM class flavin-dependent oxidoreductase [Chloroflexota bacterium]
VLSHGRTILTVCNGGGDQSGPIDALQLKIMGVKSPERVGRLIEGITILRRLWSEERVTHEGKYYRFTDVELLPKPVQQPMPIWIAVNPAETAENERIIDRGLRRVAKYADGWQTSPISAEGFRQRFATIREYAAREGRDPSKLDSCLHLMVNINDDREAAAKEGAEFLTHYYGAHPFWTEHFDDWVAHGPPDAIAEKIQSYIDAGCTTPVLRFVSMDLKAQLRRCIEEVFPLIPGVERRTLAAGPVA